MVDIPTNEPLELRAGDTWQWQRTLSDYPASAWSLNYYFIGDEEKETLAAAAAGDDYLVTVIASESCKWEPKIYRWIARVDDGTTYKTVDSGRLTVLPDLATSEPADAREHVEIVLESIEAVLQGRATKDQESYTIRGRTLSRTPIEDLLRLESHFRARVISLHRKERRKGGKSTRRNVKVRM